MDRSWPGRGLGRAQGKEEVWLTPLDGLAHDTRDAGGLSGRGAREEEQVRRKMLRPIRFWGVWRGWRLGGSPGEHTPPPPNHTHL